MSTAAELLERAGEAYRRGCAGYRDAMLETGHLLHSFVLARLSMGEGMPEEKRLKLGFRRKSAIDDAAARLGVRPAAIGVIIATAMTADLLTDGSGLGSLTFYAITRFRVFCTRQRATSGRRTGREGGLSLTSRETWAIKVGYEDSARKLLRRAVAECWTQDRCHAEVLKVFKPNGKSRRRAVLKDRVEGGPLDSLHRAVRCAAPGDVAEMCLELVRKAEDPWAVAQRLLPELAKFKRARERVIA